MKFDELSAERIAGVVALGGLSEKPERAFTSTGRNWVVQIYAERGPDGTPWQGMKRVCIAQMRNRAGGGVPKSREIECRWSVIQEIKETFFPGQLAIEVYPPEDQVIDTAPCRWLWVLPAGMKLPFSLSSNADEIG